MLAQRRMALFFVLLVIAGAAVATTAYLIPPSWTKPLTWACGLIVLCRWTWEFSGTLARALWL